MTIKTALAAVAGTGLCLIAIVRADSAPDPESLALANLRSLGQAALIYAADNRGWLPAGVGQLAEQRYFPKADILIDPRTGGDAPDFKKMSDQERADWAIKHSDFFMATPPNVRLAKLHDVTNTPLWVSRAGPNTSHILICYVDGHVQAFAPTTTVLPPETRKPAPSTQP